MNPILIVAILAVGVNAASYGPAGGDYGSASRSASGASLQPKKEDVPITSFERDIVGTQSDNTKFTTGNGISSSFNVKSVPGTFTYEDESGKTVQTDSSNEMSGHSYHETPEGDHISLNWVADDQGFRATGSHLPTPPPMPEEHAAAHAEANRLAAASAASAPSSSLSSGPLPSLSNSRGEFASAPAPALQAQGSFNSQRSSGY